MNLTVLICTASLARGIDKTNTFMSEPHHRYIHFNHTTPCTHNVGMEDWENEWERICVVAQRVQGLRQQPTDTGGDRSIYSGL